MTPKLSDQPKNIGLIGMPAKPGAEWLRGDYEAVASTASYYLEEDDEAKAGFLEALSKRLKAGEKYDEDSSLFEALRKLHNASLAHEAVSNNCRRCDAEQAELDAAIAEVAAVAEVRLRIGPAAPAKQKGKVSKTRVVPERAYHEASHAVVARALGVGVDFVALFPTGVLDASTARFAKAIEEARRDGIFGTAVTTHPTTPKEIEADVIISIAGPLADVRRDRRCSREGWQNDISSITELMRKQHREVDIDRLMKQHEPLVRKHWPAIKRVAEALYARRVLDQDEIDALIKAEK